MTLSLSILAILPFLTRVLAFSNSSISPILKVAARYLVGEIALITYISYDCLENLRLPTFPMIAFIAWLE